MRDTIFALSSGRPPAGLAVIRLSGAQAFEINGIFQKSAKAGPARYAHVRTLFDPVDDGELDRALVLTFPAPASFTGEDVVEWHCHGGQATIRAVLGALEKQGLGGNRRFALREAEPGEFTRRAFENGRIDLNEAEGLADLLSAETESQRRAALLMAEGHFSRRLGDWRDRLLRCAAMAEALLDFSDEDDVPDDGAEGTLRRELAALRDDMALQLDAPSAERLRDGISVVLAGPPNAGKSTLLNALAGREAAIVSDIAGTTRDRIEVPVDIGGVAFVLTDTAGLAEASTDRIEAIGIDRARLAMETADILFWLGDPTQSPRADALRIAAKSDRPGWARPVGADIALSAVTGENMAALLDMLLERARSLLPAEGHYALHKRQRDAVGAMAHKLAAACDEPDLIVVAEHLRGARVEMDRLVGRAGVEDMLGALFSRFCVGK
ncbi:MAG: tRNA uridine-5-carboxymethylaminomethyl(34) synthesis GTPase MnmE [Sphingobium sp.]